MLAGWFDISDPVQRSHFCGLHIRYDVTASQIVSPIILSSSLIIYFISLMHYYYLWTNSNSGIRNFAGVQNFFYIGQIFIA